MQREAETILKGRLKEVDHLGNGNNIRREKIRTPDSDTGRRSITSSEGFSARRLNPARAHDIRVPHGSPQIFGAIGCDALKPEGPLTTRQPAEYKWMSGYPTPLLKIGQSLLCTGSSTQIHHLHKPVPNSPIYAIYIQYGHLGP